MTALHGVTVLDFTRVVSGAYCTMLLADLGARVIKIEQPGIGDETRGWGPPFVAGESAYFLSINRNKESVTLDFKSAEGRAIIDQLLPQCDVLVENFRPGTLAKVGLDYPTLADQYPRLVYCSISGFGHTGPRRSEPGYDVVMQAEGGLMSVTGLADAPPVRVGVGVADLASGLFATVGIVSALLARDRTGCGQAVDIAMLDSVAALLSYQAEMYFTTGSAPSRMGNRHPTVVPYETFATSDGELVLAVGNDEHWRRLCRAVGLEADERFATNRSRVERYDELKPLLVERFQTKSRQCWIECLKAAGVPCGAVRDLHEVFTDPQLEARAMITEVEHPTVGALRLLGLPVKLSGTPGSVRMAPPTLGQHTNAVLGADVGLTGDEIARLRARGVV